jgi:hypothetical protein
MHINGIVAQVLLRLLIARELHAVCLRADAMLNDFARLVPSSVSEILLLLLFHVPLPISCWGLH